MDHPLCFDVGDLPQLGTLMDSGFLLWSAAGCSSDLLIPWGSAYDLPGSSMALATLKAKVDG
eukprot:11029004-Alexandrium_andersonii.AAC.1